MFCTVSAAKLLIRDLEKIKKLAADLPFNSDC